MCKPNVISSPSAAAPRGEERWGTKRVRERPRSAAAARHLSSVLGRAGLLRDGRRALVHRARAIGKMKCCAMLPARCLLTAALVVVVSDASSTCPDGWHAPVAGKCHRLTEERATAYRCADLCGSGAALVCITSTSENANLAAFVTEQAGEQIEVWTGIYQRPGSAEPAGGWDACASGAATNFSNWDEGQPNQLFQHSEDCAVLGRPSDWRAVVDDPGVWRDASCIEWMRCLCELGADATPAYLASLDAQLQRVHATARFAFLVVIPAISLAPALLRCFVRSFLARRASAADAADSTAGAGSHLPRSPSQVTAVATLGAAEAEAQRLHARFVLATAQLGWSLLVLSLTPCAFWISGAQLGDVVGDWNLYLAAFPWALALLLLTLRAIDAAAIQRLGCVLIGILPLLALLCAYLAASPNLTGHNPIYIGLLVGYTLLCLLCTALVWPVVVCDSCVCADANAKRMPPRRQLHRLWLVEHLLCLGLGGAFLGCFFAPVYIGERVAPTWRANDMQTGFLATCASCVLAAAVLTRSTRGRIRRRLNELLSPGGSQTQAAASVAALLGKRSAAATLAMATERFRAMPLSHLSPAELAKNTPDPAMHRKTVAARFGDVHAFVSHSWSDDGNAKFGELQRWAAGEASTRSMWLDKVRTTFCLYVRASACAHPPSHHTRTRARAHTQACIDQDNIADSLACLPVFLAGCQQLLCLVGPSYPFRLWCVMEIFTFVRMDRRREDIIVALLGESAELASCLAEFDAGKARCYLSEDRHALWAVIEAAFGTFEPFNLHVRNLLTQTSAVGNNAAAESYQVELRESV